jgi:protein-tyrosine phosphatase
MIDLHCHILPGVDDGAATLADALAMARAAVADGITTIVATPHAFKGPLNVPVSRRDDALAELREALQTQNIDLTILPGYECQIHENLLNILRTTPAYTLNGAGRTFLLELPSDFIPPGLEQFLFNAQMANLDPILVHPERNLEVQKNPAVLATLIDRGLQIQLTAGSLTGEFGWRARRTAKKLLTNGWVQVLASDAHNPTRKAPMLSKALEIARDLIGPSAIDLVEANPARLLRGKDVK